MSIEDKKLPTILATLSDDDRRKLLEQSREWQLHPKPSHMPPPALPIEIQRNIEWSKKRQELIDRSGNRKKFDMLLKDKEVQEAFEGQTHAYSERLQLQENLQAIYRDDPALTPEIKNKTPSERRLYMTNGRCVELLQTDAEKIIAADKKCTASEEAAEQKLSSYIKDTLKISDPEMIDAMSIEYRGHYYKTRTLDFESKPQKLPALPKNFDKNHAPG